MLIGVTTSSAIKIGRAATSAAEAAVVAVALVVHKHIELVFSLLGLAGLRGLRRSIQPRNQCDEDILELEVLGSPKVMGGPNEIALVTTTHDSDPKECLR
ncbi:hypothetical protein FRC19_011043 [Serendipita sp. 401]|nr:hypothetical protein FRC19_011043 [Serendipita sp. 401]